MLNWTEEKGVVKGMASHSEGHHECSYFTEAVIGYY